jgi:hypothetical protein
VSECSRETCFVPDTTCDLGFLDRSRCPAWSAQPSSLPVDGKTLDDVLLPWSGNALGLADISFLAGRAKPLTVGIVGPHNAGKTTLLAAWYLLLGRGLLLGPGRKFAGSCSLLGWENIAGGLRWAPGLQPTFPPHTTSRAGRAPGLLHLAVRDDAAEFRDYLLADAPGEWFKRWALNRDAADAEGARWLAEHADAFILIADREALSGQDAGSARGALQLLTQRLSAEYGTRPVALVWTKADIETNSAIEGAVRETVNNRIPDALEFPVSIISPDTTAKGTGTGLIELFDWVLNVRRRPAALPQSTASCSDPLFLFGTRTT